MRLQGTGLHRRAILAIGLLLVLATCAALTGCAKTVNVAEIKIVTADGATTTLELSKLTAFSGLGGYKKSTGTMVGPNTFKGVKVSDLLAEVGGLGDSQGVKLVATDGYAMTLSKAQLEGQVMTYTPEGDALTIGGVEAVIAYDMDGEAPFDGGPRFVFLTEQGAWTDGHFWVKYIDTIEFVAQVDDWTIAIVGVEDVTLDRATFESMATCLDTPHPALEYQATEKDGSISVYTGVPLWVLLSMADGGDVGGHYTFNDAAAQAGYTVDVVAADGFAATFESARVARKGDIIVAYLRNGEPLDPDDGPLRLVGDGLTSGKERIGQIAEIRIEGIE